MIIYQVLHSSKDALINRRQRLRQEGPPSPTPDSQLKTEDKWNTGCGPEPGCTACVQASYSTSALGSQGENNWGGCVGKLVDQKSEDGRVREELALKGKHQEKGPENVKHSQAIQTLGELHPGKLKANVVLVRD